MLIFDGNANYPMNSSVKKEYFRGAEFGNISSNPHPESIAMTQELQDILHERYGEMNIIFTSGGSESNSTIIHQFTYSGKPTILCPTTSHSSTSGGLEQLAADNKINLIWLTPNESGEFDLDKLRTLLPGVDLFACQSVDSESGTIHPLKKISEIIKNVNRELNQDTKFAIDDVQGFLKIPFPRDICDYVSLSLHKIGGPIGFGVLMYLGDLTPLIFGKQNNGGRGGTYNIAAIAASLEAIRTYKFPGNVAQDFWNGIKYPIFNYNEFLKLTEINQFPEKYFIRINTSKKTLGNVVLMAIGFGDIIMCGKAIKNYLLKRGLLIGNGSACNSESSDPVLLGSLASTNILPVVKKGFLRISFINNNQSELKKIVGEFNALNISK